MVFAGSRAPSRERAAQASTWAATVSRGERYGSGSDERLGQSGEQREVGVELDALQAAYAERQKPVVVLEASEFAFYGSPASVQVTKLLGVTRDARVVSGSRLGGGPAHAFVLCADRNDRVASALLASSVDRFVVVSPIHSARLGAVAACVESIEQGRDEVGFVVLRGFGAPRKRQAGLRADRQLAGAF